MTIYPAPKPATVTPEERRTTRLAKARATSRRHQLNSLQRQKEKARKPIPKKNEKRQQRLAVIRRQKHSAYRRSECYKAVEKRSGGRCERMLSGTMQMFGGGVLVGVDYRCPNSRAGGNRMTHNHKTYARYGGKELPSDMELLCPTCNSAYESQKRGNRRFRGKAS